MSYLTDEFGQIDIYLFDQLLRGRIHPPMRVLDAGCGSGRNLVYLLGSGFDVFATDEDPAAVDAVRRLGAGLPPSSDGERFRTDPVESLSFPDAFADVVISSAVLHFARNEPHWEAMVQSMWRVLRPGGLLFCRLASSIGMEHRVRPVGHGRFLLPDNSERYLVDQATLMTWTDRLDGELVDPLKTTVVQDQRSMTTWVVRKGR